MFQYENLRSMKIEQFKQSLEAENKKLNEQISEALNVLIALETKNGKRQIPVPGNAISGVANMASQEVEVEKVKSLTQEPANQPTAKNSETTAAKEPKEAKPKKVKQPAEKPQNPPTDDIIDVGRLDLRIGKIVDVKKHPDADSLYVEQIDCGEANPRTVVSGLVNHIPIEEMQNRIVMVLCNLKPAKVLTKNLHNFLFKLI